ncbi:outer membrane protein assembly factor BamE [Uliginosibacterium sp. sgz301328]|uniref:outer membrane protein assembly factor BamE domain-containing protein n=1 Tax=Uliginosibacterium sp. sgz301328 TaxID=3243764 RepID=UPI00359D43A8
MRLRRACLVLGACLMLFACDWVAENKLKPNESTVEDVHRYMGQPTKQWPADDGGVILEYSRMPNGTHNYMLHISPDGVLLSMEQVLTEENFNRIHTGMSEDEVRRILGAPISRVPFRLKQQVVWDWPYVGMGTQEMRFNVHFGPDGRVVEVSRTMVQTAG